MVGPVGISKSPDMVVVLLASLKFQIWLFSCWHLKKFRYGCYPVGISKSPYMVVVLLASLKVQVWLLSGWHL